MAERYATGAVHVFVGSSGTGPLYFGTCESMPQDSRSPEYEMLMNDVSGSKVPLDVAWEGESAQISLVMTRWDEEVAQYIESSPAGHLGYWNWSEVGSLMGLEDLATELWLVYTFGSILANKTVYVANGMRAGRHYPQTVMWSPQTDETGTKPMKRHFMFYAWPKVDATGTFANKKFTLWDYDFTGVNGALIT